MNWFKKLFGIGETSQVDENGLPKVECTVPMPKVKPTKPEKDISEPVISFVKCVRKNPGRFSVGQKMIFSQFDHPLEDFWIIDKVNGKRFAINRDCLVYQTRKYEHSYINTETTSFMTKDEMEFAYSEISKVYNDRAKKLNHIKAFRQRRDLTKLYKES